MNRFEQAFRLLPDLVVITDAYWYIIDYNHEPPFAGFRKGKLLSRYMPDCTELPHDKYSFAGKVYQRSVSAVYEDQICVGYVAYLADITEKEQLVEMRRRKTAQMDEMIRKQKQANAELEDYARQVRELNDYEEQLRIARAIHDDAGHAVTQLNMISRMCLLLRGRDQKEYDRLLGEGIAICRNSARDMGQDGSRSLKEMLEDFRASSPFPIELVITGEEPDFAAELRKVIMGVCREAYHNTIAHSMADKLMVRVCMTAEELTVQIEDNGSFHGVLEKGFGLTVMEENVRASGGTLVLTAQEGRGFGVLAKWRARS